jgi:hypothetical protein
MLCNFFCKGQQYNNNGNKHLTCFLLPSFGYIIIGVQDKQRQRQKGNLMLRLRHSNTNVNHDISKFYTDPVTRTKLSLNTKKTFNSNSHIF